MINAGYYNYIAQDRIISIIVPTSKPTRHLIRAARKEGRVLDLTMGKRTRSVIVMDSNHVVLSASSPKTLVDRIRGSFKKKYVSTC